MSGACIASLFKKIAPKNKSGLKLALEFFFPLYPTECHF